MRAKTPLFLALLALATPRAMAAYFPPPVDSSLQGLGGASDYLSDSFIGPRTPDQQKAYDAAQLSRQQSALGVGNACIPWHPPCKMPEENKPEDTLKEGNADGNGWVKVKDGWADCTAGSSCKMPSSCAENPGMAPCKAEAEQKRLEDNKKKAAKEYADANANQWGNGANKAGKVGVDATAGANGLLSGMGAGTGANGSNAPVEGVGEPVAALGDDIGIKSIVDEVLDASPDGSAFSGDGSSRKGADAYGAGNVGLGQGISAFAANMTDNGDDVSVTSPGGSTGRGAAAAKKSALGQANKAGRKPPTATSGSPIMDWLSSAWTFDAMKPGTASRDIERPSYRNTGGLGQTVPSNDPGTSAPMD